MTISIPQKFKNLVAKDIESAMVSHSYILHGENEDVIEQAAVYFSQKLLCEQANSPCKTCAICQNITKGIHSDVLQYPLNSKSIKVEDANDIVSKSLVVALSSKYKIFILNKFHLATTAAQNKLLKTLEEPSKNVVFLITATNINGVLNTIKSRSKQVYVADEKIFEKDLNNSIENQTLNLALKAIMEMKRSSEVLSVATEIITLCPDLLSVVEKVQSVLSDVLKAKNNLTAQYLHNEQKYYDILDLSAELTDKAVLEIMNLCNNLVNEVNANCNKNLALENFLIKILETKYKSKMGLL